MSDHVAVQTVDTRDMNTVHTFFRREFRLVGGVIRGVPDGDVDRARVVADHLAYIGRSLHHHHTAEDELEWPLLLQGMSELVKVRPNEPVEWLAHYLINNNPNKRK